MPDRQQKARVAELEAALAPFAAIAGQPGMAVTRRVVGPKVVYANLNDCDRAAAALKGERAAAVAPPDLLAALEAALAHVLELEDAWQRGALNSSDGWERQAERSNRNVEVRVALQQAIAKATGQG